MSLRRGARRFDIDALVVLSGDVVKAPRAEVFGLLLEIVTGGLQALVVDKGSPEHIQNDLDLPLTGLQCTYTTPDSGPSRFS